MEVRKQTVHPRTSIISYGHCQTENDRELLLYIPNHLKITIEIITLLLGCIHTYKRIIRILHLVMGNQTCILVKLYTMIHKLPND